MRLATIRGHVTSTVKHSSLAGWRLLIAQPQNADGSPDGPPQIVIDDLGAGVQEQVIISSDGMESRKMVGDDSSPARWNVLGLVDVKRSTNS